MAAVVQGHSHVLFLAGPSCDRRYRPGLGRASRHLSESCFDFTASRSLRGLSSKTRPVFPDETPLGRDGGVRRSCDLDPKSDRSLALRFPSLNPMVGPGPDPPDPIPRTRSKVSPPPLTVEPKASPARRLDRIQGLNFVRALPLGSDVGRLHNAVGFRRPWAEFLCSLIGVLQAGLSASKPLFLRGRTSPPRRM